MSCVAQLAYRANRGAESLVAHSTFEVVSERQYKDEKIKENIEITIISLIEVDYIVYVQSSVGGGKFQSLHVTSS